MAFTVSGTLLDPSNVPVVGYRVLCYNRATGAFISEALTTAGGVWSIVTLTADPVFCLALDHVNSLWAASILDNIIPL